MPEGIVEVVMDAPPVNALTVARVVRARRGRHARPAQTAPTRAVILRAEGKGFNAGVDIKEMQNTAGLRRARSAPTRVLRRLRRGVRLRRPGDRRGRTGSASAAASASSATATSSSPATTPTSVCPRSTAARSARPPTWPGSCRSTRCGRWSTRRPRRPPPSCSAGASVLEVVPRDAAPRRTAREVAAVDRGQVADGHPRRQGEPQRHRPVGRQAQLPLRAGLHVRAQPHGRQRRAARRLRRHRQGRQQAHRAVATSMSEHATSGRPRTRPSPRWRRHDASASAAGAAGASR